MVDMRTRAYARPYIEKKFETKEIFLTYDYPERAEGDPTQTLYSYMIQLFWPNELDCNPLTCNKLERT